MRCDTPLDFHFSGVPDSQILDREKARDAGLHKYICTAKPYGMPPYAGSSSSIKHPEICRGTEIDDKSY